MDFSEMNDQEILETYEPVLRFAKSERFYPMDAERYLDNCQVFPTGPGRSRGYRLAPRGCARQTHRAAARRPVLPALRQ